MRAFLSLLSDSNQRTAQPATLASVKTWGNSGGAGREGLTRVQN